MVMAAKQNEGHRPSTGRYLDQEKVRKALDAATAHGASYAEVRVVALTESTVAMRDGVLERVRSASREARVGVLVSPRAPQDIFGRAERVAAEAIHPHTFLINEALVAEAHARGLAVYPYTANDPAEMSRLLDAGVDGVITNFPRVLGDLLGARGTG